MSEVCKLVPSQKGNNKINVRGYLMVKERTRKNKYYWCCEKRKSEGCKGRANRITNILLISKTGNNYTIISQIFT